MVKNMNKNVLVLGAGMVSRPLVRYLLDNDFNVVMASRTVSKAEKIINGHPNGEAISFNVTDYISASRGDLIVFIDSDLDIDVEYIQNYIEKSEMADIVIASKWHRDSKVEATLLRKLLSKSFHLLVEFFLRLGVKDTQTGLKVGKKKHLSKIFSNILIKKYAFDIEMLLMARLMRLKIIELPIKLKLKSKFKIKEIIRMFVDILAVTYRLRVLRWYQRVLR